MHLETRDPPADWGAATGSRSTVAVLLAVTLGLTAAVVAAGASLRPQSVLSLLGVGGRLLPAAAVVVVATLVLLAAGTWRQQNWARTAVMGGLTVFVVYQLVIALFALAAEVFAGTRVVPIADIVLILLRGTWRFGRITIGPGLLLLVLGRIGDQFEETVAQRKRYDVAIRYVLVLAALSAVFVVALIIVFTVQAALDSVREIGITKMLFGMVWRPGSIIGTDEGQFGVFPMIIGTLASTLGAAAIGVPLSIGAAILLAEVAPVSVREIMRPAIELLAGIPSVVYGLFGMVVLAPLIRQIAVPRNTGFGVLNASIVLAVMIIPTITSVAEDAIRAVPRAYKEGALALGSTHWQTIFNVLLPSARSGILAAIILGIGRALGETMAVIMVIGNAIALIEPLTNNPLTILLAPARTLTGNIAVEINYAAGPHRSALFFTGVLLFCMILAVNSLARRMMRERIS